MRNHRKSHKNGQVNAGFSQNNGQRTAFVHFTALLQGRQHQTQLRYDGGTAMKKRTTHVQGLIETIENTLKDEMNPTAKNINETILQLLNIFKRIERFQIEDAFEDGVGEGMTDPERPLSGQEYYDIKYKK